MFIFVVECGGGGYGGAMGLMWDIFGGSGEVGGRWEHVWKCDEARGKNVHGITWTLDRW